MQPVELQPGDVLLSCGDSEVSRGIVELDGGSYSHAALWSGEQVIESTLPRVRAALLAECGEHALYIDVFRHRERAQSGHAIVAQAEVYLDRPYGVNDLALSTLLIAVSSWMPTDWAEMTTLYGASSLGRMLRLLRLVAQEDADERVTCSELVVRAHLNAGVPFTVTLQGGRTFKGASFLRALRELAARVRERPSARGGLFDEDDLPGASLAAELRWLESLPWPVEDPASMPRLPQEAWLALRTEWWLSMKLVELPAGDAARLAELNPEALAARRLLAGRDFAAGLVTPRQIEHSPDFVHIGRVHGS